MSVAPPGLLEILYTALFAPKILFDDIAARQEAPTQLWPMLMMTLAIVVTLAMILPIAMQVGTNGSGSGWLVFSIILNILGSVMEWLLISGLVALIGYSFTGKNRWIPLLIVMGLAGLPWMFLAPARMLGHASGYLGPLVQLLLIGALVGWSLWLNYLGIARLYQMRGNQLGALLIAPTLLSLVSLLWVGDFIAILQRIFS